MSRYKELAIRKLSGGSNRGLILALQLETLSIAAIALVLSIFLVLFFLPIYNNFTNSHLSYIFQGNVVFFVGYFLLTLIIGLISGLYPALFAVSYNTIQLLRDKMNPGYARGFNVRKLLVGLQFFLAALLLNFSLLFYSQVQYLITKDLGFSKENLLYAQLEASQPHQNYESIRRRALECPQIKSISMSRTLPFVNNWGGMIDWEGASSGEKAIIKPNYITPDFLDNLQIHLLKGRNLSFTSDTIGSCLVNETAVKTFDYNDPIGRK